MFKRLTLSAAALAMAVIGAAAPASAQNVTIGVSIPAADHGWTGGINYYASETAKSLEKRYPGLKVIVKAGAWADPGQQANDLEDFATVQKVNALVVLPVQSDPLTGPVAEFKQKTGAFITVVDRGLKDPSIQDLYVAGDNPGLGAHLGRVFQEGAGRQGRHRRAARHPDRDRHAALSTRSSRPSRAPTSRCSPTSSPTGTATTASR